MKILLIRNYPSYMAVENNTYNIQEVGLAKALVRNGYQCDIVFWTDDNEKDIEINVDGEKHIIVYYRKAISFLKNAIYTKCQALFDEYDILQTSEYNQLETWILARKYREKTIVYHGPYYCDFNRKYNFMCKVFDVFFLKLYKKNDTKFITKSSLATTFLERKGIKRQNITTLGVGIDVDMLNSSFSNCGAVRNNELADMIVKDKCQIKLLYVGQIEPRRDTVFLIDVLNELVKLKADVHLYMIGLGDVKYVKNVRQRITRYSLTKYVTWIDCIEQKYLSEIYEQTTFFLLPTEYEIFGMVLLEAMYYKNIVLTTKNGGSETLITDGNNGFILEKDDSITWANKILSIAKEENLMREMGNLAKKTIEENYLWDKLADRFVKAYGGIE